MRSGDADAQSHGIRHGQSPIQKSDPRADRDQSKTATKTRREQTAVGQDMTTADAAVAALIAHGIDTIYALPGRSQRRLLRRARPQQRRPIRTVHTRHEQGAAYMALGAALATGKAAGLLRRARPGPAQLRGGAAHRLRHQCAGAGADRPNSRAPTSAGLRPSARDPRSGRHHRAPGRLVGAHPRAERRAAAHRRGHAVDAASAAPARRRSNAPSMSGAGPDRCGPSRRCRCAHPPIDEDAVKQAAKRLGAAKRPLIVAGGGAQDASAEVTRLGAHAAGAGPRLSPRPRRARRPRSAFSVNLPLGHELWARSRCRARRRHAPAHAAAAMGLRPRSRASSRSMPIRRSRRACASPQVALIGEAAADPAAAARRCCRRTTRGGPRARRRCSERHERMRKRLAKLAPQLAYLRRDPRRTAGGRHFCRRGDADRLRLAACLSGLSAAHFPLARLSGQSRLGLCHRARRAGCAPRRTGRGDHRRRRLHVHGNRDGDRGTPPHSADHRRVQRRRLSAMCAASRRSASATA